MKVHEPSTYAETFIKHGYSGSKVCMRPVSTVRRMSIDVKIKWNKHFNLIGISVPLIILSSEYIYSKQALLQL